MHQSLLSLIQPPSWPAPLKIYPLFLPLCLVFTLFVCFESSSPIGGACWNPHWWPVFWLAWACGSLLRRVTAAMRSWVELPLPAQERAFHSSSPHSSPLALCPPPSSMSLSLAELMWMSRLRAEPLRIPYLSTLSGYESLHKLLPTAGRSFSGQH